MFTSSIRRPAVLLLLGLLLIPMTSGAADQAAAADPVDRLRVQDVRAVPSRIAFQGSLADSGGNPVEGVVDLDLALYSDEFGGTAAWSESQLGVVVTGGHFRVALGSEAALPMSIFDGSPLWLGVSVEGEAELPREEILSAPFALRALEADHALTADVAIGDDGDWTVDGGNVYRETGFVGIGTTAPSNPLQIAQEGGTGFLMGSLEGGSVPLLHLRNWATAKDWVIRHDETRLHFQREASIGSEVMTLTHDNRLGIGTTNPDTKLHIEGFGDATLANGTGAVVLGDVTATNLVMDDNEIMARSNGAIAHLNLNLHGGDVVIGSQAATPRLGIGKLPATALDVVGSTTTSGDLEVGGAYKGNIGPNGGAPFPRPAFDSGWRGGVDCNVPGGSIGELITHNLGGDVNDYFVDVVFRNANGIHAIKFGGDRKSDSHLSGAWWNRLTNTGIWVNRGCEDGNATNWRVRIWVIQ